MRSLSRRERDRVRGRALARKESQRCCDPLIPTFSLREKEQELLRPPRPNLLPPREGARAAATLIPTFSLRETGPGTHSPTASNPATRTAVSARTNRTR